MNDTDPYTRTESLYLFRLLGTQGVDNNVFQRISEQLSNNAFIQSDARYEPTRLTPEALQKWFFFLLQRELKELETPATASAGSNGSEDRNGSGSGSGSGNEVANKAGNASASPGPKKRKLGSSPTPSPRWEVLADNLEKFPLILKRLEDRWQEQAVYQIREDEKKWDFLQLEITLIEKSERERLARLAANEVASSSTSGPRDSRPTGSPASTTAATPNTVRKGQTPVVPPKPPVPNIAPSSHLPPGAAAVRPPSTQPINGPGTVLQPPRVLQPPTPTPKVPISPRTEAAAAKPKEGPVPPTASAAQGTLKWEKPYQPPQTPTPPARNFQSPVPKAGMSQPPQAPNQQQWQQQPHQQVQQSQQQQQALQPQPVQPSQVPQARSGQEKPNVVASNAGHAVPSVAPGPPRPTGATLSPQPRPQSKTPIPPPHPRPIQPQQLPSGQQPPRPIAASPAIPAGTSGHPRWPHSPHLSQSKQQGFPTGSPSSAAAQKLHSTQPPRPPIPEHMIRHAAAGTPIAARRANVVPSAPQTPINTTPLSLPRYSATKWAAQSSPATPGPSAIIEPESPAFEPVSPPLQSASLKRPLKQVSKQPAKAPPPNDAPVQRPGRGRQQRVGSKGRPSGASSGRRSQSVVSQTDEPPAELVESASKVKNEAATPRGHEETGDTTADESVSGKGTETLKRKREDTPSEYSGPPTHVLWTRGFTKVSSSALDQISSHRDANMFATALRERDAPNYRQIVLQPQDITSIRSAIKNGNKAAVQASNNLPGGDPGTNSVWLPISEDLVPPKGIVNSAQLERELVHMFCNAIMYNADPNRGPGPTFMKRSQEEEEEILGYHLDENGVVRNTQSMFLEVEKLLGDLRSAERQRIGPPSATPRPTSVATPAEDTTAEDEDDAAAEGEGSSGTVKRRRLATKL